MAAEDMQSNFEPTETPVSRRSFLSARSDFIQKIFILAVFGLFFLTLWQGAEVFLLVFAGLLLAIFLRSLSGFLARYTPLSDKLALAIVLLGIVGGIVFGVWFLSDSMERQFTELSERLPVVYEQAKTQISQYPLGRKFVEKIPSAQEFVFGRRTANIFGRVTGFFSSALDWLVNVLIVFVTAVYFAINPGLYREGLIKLVPRRHEKRAREIIYTAEFTLRRFLLGISVSMTTTGALTVIGLWFLGVPFAIPLGIIAGLLTFIPNIGPVIAGTPAVLIALSQSPLTALYVLILYFAVQNFDGFVMTPLVQQKTITVPPVLIITAQLLLAVMFGFPGLLLAVPIIGVVFVLVKMIYVEDILDRRIKVKGEQEAKKET